MHGIAKTIEQSPRIDQPERLETVLRAGDRIRRLELAVGTIALDFARELQGRAEDRERIEALEKAVGAKAVGRQKRTRRDW